MKNLRPNAISSINPCGVFAIEHLRHGKIRNIYKIPNGTTNEGKTSILNTNFNSGQNLLWWLSLIDNTNYISVADTDTYVNINQEGNGWVEFTGYTDANNNDDITTRPRWYNDATDNAFITNATKSLFDITISGTIKGAFLVGGAAAQIKNDHSAGNILWATAFSLESTITLEAKDQLRIIYKISL
ncbi:MAG: hypothetical protein WC919_01755 [Candidatus Paceibacterota bacterium]|jgi:hypothetical protein